MVGKKNKKRKQQRIEKINQYHEEKFFFIQRYGDHRDLHPILHSFPTRRSSDLPKFIKSPNDESFALNASWFPANPFLFTSINCCNKSSCVFFCSMASPREIFCKSATLTPIAADIARFSTLFIVCMFPNPPTCFCSSLDNSPIFPSSANSLARSRFKFFPVNTCASNSDVILDSKSNSFSANLVTFSKLEPTFAA